MSSLRDVPSGTWLVERAPHCRHRSRAQREFRALAPDTQRWLDPAIRVLADDPRPPGCKRLHGQPPLWRLRVGDYRILYAIDDGNAVVRVVSLRGVLK